MSIIDRENVADRETVAAVSAACGQPPERTGAANSRGACS
jgi:hypothetical protein